MKVCKILLAAVLLFLLLATDAQAAGGLWLKWENSCPPPWCTSTVVEKTDDDVLVVRTLWATVKMPDGRTAESYYIRVWNDDESYMREYSWTNGSEPTYPRGAHPTLLWDSMFWLGVPPLGDYNLRVEAYAGERIWSVQLRIRVVGWKL